MRPVVAIISARPETIADDYVRLLELAGLEEFAANGNSFLAAEARGAGWRPGLVCPPWQVDALLKKLCRLCPESPASPLLLAVGDSGPAANLRGFGWDEVLDRHDLRGQDADTIASAPFRPKALLPALEGVLPQGFRISPHFRGKNLMLSSAMSFQPGGILGANVALLSSLLAANQKIAGKIPLVEVLAEVVGLAREVFASMAVVTDATVVSVVRRGGRRAALVRNLLVAGSDPVAVDSVLLRIAGLDPADCPWLKLCQDRGLAVADLKGMHLVGETEWLDLDFQIPDDIFASDNKVAGWLQGGLWNRMVGRGGPTGSSSLESAWDRLFRDYQSGVTL